ncbi:MAG: peptidylprolyl isomerase [Deltaproteobacteria bacterium]|jgi:cyclophilin family peptidyl-prolyl cis-trans isomerase|nr:peptidylprolyl isomerase [Deltaproteobacteria bacterium]
MVGRTLLIVLVSCGALILHGVCRAAGAEKEAKPDTQQHDPIVVLKTSLGVIKIQLWPDKAPETVKNFLRYVNEGFYNGTIFHRVIGNFMIQGGGFTPDMVQKQTHSPIKNEARSDVKNERGTIAMARTMAVNSATSQFFINVVDNPSLNHLDDTPAGYGYAVFGKVIDGMSVVDKIKDVPTHTVGPFQNVPVTPVVIESATVEK